MKRATPKPPGDLSLALTAAREAVGDAAALQRVRSGVLTKIAAGAAPSAAVSVAGAWLGKGLAALLLTAGAGALVYNVNTELPPPAASAPARQAPPPAPPQPEPGRVVEPPAPTEVVPTPKPIRVAVPRAKTPVKRPQPTAAAAQAPCFDAAAEVELLSSAQQALRAQPQLALSLLNEHAQRFSCGVLALERDSLRIDAERALGMDAQASEHARELVAHYPQAPETRALKQRLDAAANSGDDHKTQPVGTPTP